MGNVIRIGLPLALFALGGCQSEGERAAEAFKLAEQNSLFDRHGACREANRAKDAYLKEGNGQEYESWSVTAYNACHKAERGY